MKLNECSKGGTWPTWLIMGLMTLIILVASLRHHESSSSWLQDSDTDIALQSKSLPFWLWNLLELHVSHLYPHILRDEKYLPALQTNKQWSAPLLQWLPLPASNLTNYSPTWRLFLQRSITDSCCMLTNSAPPPASCYNLFHPFQVCFRLAWRQSGLHWWIVDELIKY